MSFDRLRLIRCSSTKRGSTPREAAALLVVSARKRFRRDSIRKWMHGRLTLDANHPNDLLALVPPCEDRSRRAIIPRLPLTQSREWLSDGQEFIATRSGSIRKMRPARLVRLLIGELTPAAVLAAADDADPNKKRSGLRSNFFGGELARRQGAKEQATRLFRLAAADCPHSSNGSRLRRSLRHSGKRLKGRVPLHTQIAEPSRWGAMTLHIRMRIASRIKLID
jgi:hypothetical protein